MKRCGFRLVGWLWVLAIGSFAALPTDVYATDPVCVPWLPDQIACIINNGLAPPNPDNVLVDDTYANARVFVRNVGCELISCSSPGSPTAVSLAGGHVNGLTVRDSSTLTIDDGLTYGASAADSATMTMTGGIVFYGIGAHGSSTVTIAGGQVPTGPLQARDSSTIVLVGRNFKVGPEPVPFGTLTATTGYLTGTLGQEGHIVAQVYHGGVTCGGSSTCDGTIVLAEAPPPPFVPSVPALSSWGYHALVSCLVGFGLLCGRRSPKQ